MKYSAIVDKFIQVLKILKKDALVPLMVTTKTSVQKQESRQFLTSRFLLLGIAFLFLCVLFCCSCSSHHYFSVNAEEMVNPSIEYSDSSNIRFPIKK